MTNATGGAQGSEGKKGTFKAVLAGVVAFAGAAGAVAVNADKVAAFACDHFQVLCWPKPTPKTAVPEKFTGASVTFARSGNVWTEYSANGNPSFHYVTGSVDEDYVYIVDNNRVENNDPNKPFTVRIPIHGGMSEWAYPNPYQWRQLYPVTPA